MCEAYVRSICAKHMCDLYPDLFTVKVTAKSMQKYPVRKMNTILYMKSSQEALGLGGPSRHEKTRVGAKEGERERM
jgi:hypothetical protein